MQFSCSKNKIEANAIILQPNYGQIQDIITIADCDSPFGKYETEVHSFNNGSCLFLQRSILNLKING